MLSLAEAITNGRFDEFIEQEEKRLAPNMASLSEFDETLSTLVKLPRSTDQTSHSAFGDDLIEK
jgi:hypothetical protein